MQLSIVAVVVAVAVALIACAAPAAGAFGCHMSGAFPQAICNGDLSEDKYTSAMLCLHEDGQYRTCTRDVFKGLAVITQFHLNMDGEKAKYMIKDLGLQQPTDDKIAAGFEALKNQCPN